MTSPLAQGQETFFTPERILEQGLISLRMSVQKLDEKNRWLAENIREFQAQLPRLEKELADMEKKQSSANERLQSSVNEWEKEKKAFSYAVEGRERISADIVKITMEVDKLELDYKARQRKWEDVAERVGQLKTEIGKLKESIEVKDKEIKSGFAAVKAGILKEKQIVQQDLDEARKQWQKLNEEFGGQASELESLKLSRNELNQKITIITDELKIVSDGNKELMAKIDGIEEEQNKEEAALRKEVGELNIEHDKLRQVLEEASNKIDIGKLSGEIQRRERDEIGRLEQNLLTLKKANEELKAEKTKITQTKK